MLKHTMANLDVLLQQPAAKANLAVHLKAQTIHQDVPHQRTVVPAILSRQIKTAPGADLQALRAEVLTIAVVPAQRNINRRLLSTSLHQRSISHRQHQNLAKNKLVYFRQLLP